MPPSVASLARNACSICRASAAVNVFLAPMIRCAQTAASSDEAIELSSPMRRSRKVPDSWPLRIGFAEFAITLVLRWPGIL